MTDAAVAGDEEAGSQTGRKRLSGKKLVFLIILPTLLLLGGGAGAYAVFLADGASLAGWREEEPTVAAFYELPEMLVNLNTNGKKQSYLKLRVALELEDGTQIPALEAILPRIIDGFQVYLRELRLEDLSGSAGLVRLKEELLYRVNVAAATIRINDVLFKEMLVQ